MYEERIGNRVRALRVARGLNQRELARRANVSYSLLTKVESGHATASPVFTGAIARALRVDVPRVTGQPYEGPRPDRVFQAVAATRRSLLIYDLDTELPAPPRTLDELRADVARMSLLRRRTRFTALAAELPGLLDEVGYLVRTTPTEVTLALLGELFYAAECLGSGLGHHDVYLLATERVSWVAQRSADPLLKGAAAWGQAGPLMHEGALGTGLDLLERTGERINPAITSASSVLGSLHLRSALLAARVPDATRAWDHIAEAQRLAELIGTETNGYELSFGPSNVAVTSVTVAVELADAVRTVELARAAQHVDAAPERRGHLFIDAARGHLMNSERRAALKALQQARRVAPEQTRAHPMSREVALAIAANGRGSDELTRFISWLGLEP